MCARSCLKQTTVGTFLPLSCHEPYALSRVSTVQWLNHVRKEPPTDDDIAR